MTFWSFRKNGFIRKIRLMSKFMTSQLGEQTIAIHILPNITGRKRSQAMKLGEIFFFKNYGESKAGRLAPDLFLFFKCT